MQNIMIKPKDYQPSRFVHLPFASFPVTNSEYHQEGDCTFMTGSGLRENANRLQEVSSETEETGKACTRHGEELVAT
jgi:hypothetical protein